MAEPVGWGHLPLAGAGEATRGRPGGGRSRSSSRSRTPTSREPGCSRNLTWWDLTVFGVSVVVGAGIFTVTASIAGNITGPAISVSFIIAAITCGLAALCY
ncbi:MAG: amino acid permease, partial [Mycobacterium sp.]|nr:amino acid permease [Mycobacterium sp.]